jgi:murein tripeptide amidase MpaA
MQAKPFSSPARLKALPQFLVTSVLAAVAWVTTTTRAQDSNDGRAAPHSPAVSVASDFEGGKVEKVERVSETHLRCAVPGESDQDKRNRQPSWFYFRLDGVAGKDLTIDLTDLAGEYNYRRHNGAGLRNMRPVYSYDDRTWHHFDASEWNEKASTIRIRLRPTANRVWIARQPPYTDQHLKRLIAGIRQHPHFRETIVGKTVEGRPMLLLTITNPEVADSSKKVIWLMARQHSWESGTSWVAEGALRFLLSDDPEAARLRDGYIFKVFPLADPDGVCRGGVRFNKHGYDLNRNWDTVDARLMPEIHAQRQAMLDWVDGGRRLELFLTLHNTEAADFIEGPPAAQPLGNRFWKLLVDGTSFYSPRGPRVDTAGTTTPGMKGRMSVNQALFHERKIPAFLMELMVDSSPKLSRSPTVQDRLEFGAGLVRAMCAAVEEPAR